jgi:hypothetical protein
MHGFYSGISTVTCFEDRGLDSGRDHIDTPDVQRNVRHTLSPFLATQGEENLEKI